MKMMKMKSMTMKSNLNVYLALFLLIFICIGFPMYEGFEENLYNYDSSMNSMYYSNKMNR